jgi:hypothetical protein
MKICHLECSSPPTPHFCRPLHSAARDGRTTGPPLATTPLYLYTHIQDRHKHKHALEKNIICGQ